MNALLRCMEQVPVGLFGPVPEVVFCELPHFLLGFGTVYGEDLRRGKTEQGLVQFSVVPCSEMIPLEHPETRTWRFPALLFQISGIVEDILPQKEQIL